MTPTDVSKCRCGAYVHLLDMGLMFKFEWVSVSIATVYVLGIYSFKQ